MKLSEIDAHLSPNPIDHKPGHYYISVVDGDNVGLLSGPYLDHQEALDFVNQAKKIAFRVDSKAPWYLFGTLRLDISNKNPIGVLSKLSQYKHSLKYSSIERRKRKLQKSLF